MSYANIEFEDAFEETDKLLVEAIGLTSMQLDNRGLAHVLLVLAEQIARKRLAVRYFAAKIAEQMGRVAATGTPVTLLGSSLSRDYEAAFTGLQVLGEPWKNAVSAYKREHPAKG